MLKEGHTGSLPELLSGEGLTVAVFFSIGIFRRQVSGVFTETRLQQAIATLQFFIWMNRPAVVFASPNQFWRSREMKYIKAQNVLPDEVIKIIQEYVDGEFLYIPRKDGRHKAWGESSGARCTLKERNRQIFTQYSSGISIPDLSKLHFLSEQSIRRIIGQEKAYFSSSLHNHV